VRRAEEVWNRIRRCAATGVTPFGELVEPDVFGSPISCAARKFPFAVGMKLISPPENAFEVN
jgi:hypothetical protein